MKMYGMHYQVEQANLLTSCVGVGVKNAEWSYRFESKN